MLLYAHKKPQTNHLNLLKSIVYIQKDNLVDEFQWSSLEVSFSRIK